MGTATVVVGDLFKSKAQTLINTVNCVGVMGKGIALEFKRRFPSMYEDYVARCRRREVRLGQPYLYKDKQRWIVNFPTKGHWRAVTRLSDIENGLQYLLEHYRSWGIQSIAVPPLGCGLGQLEWRVVGPTLYRYFSAMDVDVEMYAPHGTPHEELTPAFLQGDLFDDVSNMPEARYIRPAWVALVEILDRLRKQPHHRPIGRVYFQKLAYVASISGLPTNLEFKRSSYGPFSAALKPMITRLQNNGLIREVESGKMFQVATGPTFTDAKRAYAQDLARWESVIERTVDLFMRMDTNKAEIAATVLFAATALRADVSGDLSEKDVFDYIMEWKQRRRPPLDPEDVALAIRNLAAFGWLKVEPSDHLPVRDEEFA